ncbi:Transport and Golgi organization-like-like protein [Cladobotryum mycophilum]|uniref:Transport and Golgi organization-like-like protein n=1 Tax=Cladobotryum mycophilum TaxID=491253 RepID=A0ABR0SU92_9HYPO
MCIVLFTTAHPEYSLILIDNRDEFVLRPTSRPHWWKHPNSNDEILSSRDLQRSAKGTWLGITKTGILAVLTNYRETNQPIHNAKSRGQIVNAWLGGLPDEGVEKAVHTIVKDGGVQGIGGFSMVCGKLKRNGEGIAIVSNRAADVNDVPIISLDQDGVWGLSNTVYSNPKEWPKVTTGKRLLKEAVSAAVSNKSGEEELIAGLFSVLDNNTIPERPPGLGLNEYLAFLRYTVLVPLIGDEAHKLKMQQAAEKGHVAWADMDGDSAVAVEELVSESRPDSDAKGLSPLFDEGMYGTQRQTIILVDLDGNVTFIERALWDANGNMIPQGEGDVTFRFKIDGWEDQMGHVESYL